MKLFEKKKLNFVLLAVAKTGIKTAKQTVCSLALYSLNP